MRAQRSRAEGIKSLAAGAGSARLLANSARPPAPGLATVRSLVPPGPPLARAGPRASPRAPDQPRCAIEALGPDTFNCLYVYSLQVALIGQLPGGVLYGNISQNGRISAAVLLCVRL